VSGYWETPDYTGDASVVDPANKTGLLLAEDDALKWYVSGLKVPVHGSSGDTVEAQTWFRFPEGERREQYPFITIDWLGITPSYERWTSLYKVDETDAYFTKNDGSLDYQGMYVPSVSPTINVSKTSTQGYSLEPYLMYRLLYQITVHSRSAQHDRILTSRMLTDVFPPRPFWIPVDADHTWRRAELVEMAPNDTLETTESGSKRIFRKAFTVSMDAELQQSRIEAIEKARMLHTDFYPSSDRNQPLEPADHLSTSSHSLGEPLNVEFVSP
jgi:hypothetical protein